MRTAAELVPTRYIKTERGQHPEPRFRQHWSRLRKLQWKASLIMAEHPGVRLYIAKGREFSNGSFIYGTFQFSYNNGGLSAMSYERLWDLLNGVSCGLDIAKRLADKEVG